jgi:hypothetical protein
VSISRLESVDGGVGMQNGRWDIPVRTPQAGCHDPAWKEVKPSIHIYH